jgi:hypothetical protein
MNRMLITILNMSFILLVYLSVIGPTVSPAEAAELAQSQGLMQCMEKCIRDEGKSEKATCKSRCANVPSAFGKQPKQRDCMAVYKGCKKNCPKRDKKCNRACKANLMQCS